MRADFIEKTKKMLLSKRVAHESVTNLGNYLGGKFLQSVRFVGKIFTAIGLAVKGIMLAFNHLQTKNSSDCGYTCNKGVALFMFGKKIYEVGAKIKEVLEVFLKKLEMH